MQKYRDLFGHDINTQKGSTFKSFNPGRSNKYSVAGQTNGTISI